MTRIAILIGVFIWHLSALACIATDSTGAVIQLKQPAKRIISLAPDITEILFAIKANDKIVGVIKGSDYPPSALKIPIVGSVGGLDLERMLALKPDLIITWGETFSTQLHIFKQLGIPVYKTNPHVLEDIPNTMQALGCLTAQVEPAERAARAFRQRLQKIKATYANQKPITVFYQIDDYSLITINKNSWINEVLALCGGQNVFANLKTVAPEVSWEAVMMADPEVVFCSTRQNNWKKRWQFSAVRAVKNGNLFTISPDLVERAGPRLTQAATEICLYLSQTRKRTLSSQTLAS